MSDIAGDSKIAVGDSASTEIFRDFPESFEFSDAFSANKVEHRGSPEAITLRDVLDSQYIRNTLLAVTLSDSLSLSDFSSTAGADVILSDGFFIPESDYVQVRLQLLNNGLNVTDSILNTSSVTLEHTTVLPNNDVDVFPIKTMLFGGAFATPNDGDILFTFNKPKFKTNLRVSATVNSPFGLSTLEVLSIIDAPPVNLPAIPQEFDQVFDDADWTEPDFAPGSPGPTPEAQLVLTEFSFTDNVLDSDISYTGGGNRFIFNAGPPETLDFQSPDDVLFNTTRLSEKTVINLFDNTLAAIDANHNPSGFVLDAGALFVTSALESNLTSKSNTYVATFRNTLVPTGVDNPITLETSGFTAINAALDVTVSGWLGIENLDEGTEIESTSIVIDYFNHVGTKLAGSTTKVLTIDNGILLQTFSVSETTIPVGATKLKFRFVLTSLDGGDAIKFRLLLPQVVQLGQSTTDIFGVALREGDVWTIPQAGNIDPGMGTFVVQVIGGGAASVGTLFDTTDPTTGQNGFKLEYDGTNWTFTIDDAGAVVTLVGADSDIPLVSTAYIVEWNQAANSRRIWRDDTLLVNDDLTAFTTPSFVPTDIHIGSNANGADQPNVVLEKFTVTRRAARGGIPLAASISDAITVTDNASRLLARNLADNLDMTDSFSTV